MKAKDMIAELQKLSPNAEVNMIVPYCRKDESGILVSDYYRLLKVSIAKDHMEKGALPQSEWTGWIHGEPWQQVKVKELEGKCLE